MVSHAHSGYNFISLLLKHSDLKLGKKQEKKPIVDQHLEGGTCCAPAWIRHWGGLRFESHPGSSALWQGTLSSFPNPSEGLKAVGPLVACL